MKIPLFLAKLLGYTPKTLTIKMSNRAPVQIQVQEWPVLVQTGTEGSKEYIVVRIHADDRVLVYGATDCFGVLLSAGYLLENPHMSTLLKTIQNVASEVSSLSLGQECLAQFKPEPL